MLHCKCKRSVRERERKKKALTNRERKGELQAIEVKSFADNVVDGVECCIDEKLRIQIH